MVIFLNILIDLSKKEYMEIKGSILPITFGMDLHHKYKTYDLNPYDENCVFCFGRGVVPVIGGNRLIFTFKSPQWEGIHLSAMGGAGYQFKDTGLNNVAIMGKCDKPTLLVINGEEKDENGNNIIKLDYINLEEQIKNYESIYDLNNYILNMFKDKNHRSFIVGPSAINTNLGGILSHTVRNGKFVDGSEDWAARGGVGSSLFQGHNIVGVVFFGDKNNSNNKKENEIKKTIKDKIEKYYNEPMTKTILAHTKKYRYDQEVNTGGTFGCNYMSLKDKTPMFNWNMIYMPKEERTELHKKLLKYYVEAFNKESIEPKKWTNCGEPCPVLCKKYRLNNYKVDYEPYSANGPQLGIFDIHETDHVTHAIDEKGYDSIEMGSLIAWVFELLYIGLLKPEEVGIDIPKFDSSYFKNNEDLLNNSKYNSELAVKLINIITYRKNEIGEILSLGKRNAAQIFNEKFKERLKDGKKYNDYGVYIPFGKNGDMAPTLYWAIGNFMPFLIQGKYLTFYKYGVFFEPEKLAQLSVERTIEEGTIENLGVCRFHRGWLIPVIEDIINDIIGEEFNLKQSTMDLIKSIYEYNKKICESPKKIESDKIKDIITIGAKEFENEKWSKLFEEDRDKYINIYVKTVMDEYSKLLNINWRIKD